MTKIQNETRGAASRCCGPLSLVFLALALSFGSLAANAAPQVLKGNAGRTACRVNSINTATGVVTAKVLFEEGGIAGSKTSGSGQSFRFLVKDSALLRSLKDGQEIFADFNTQLVFTGAGVRLGTILADNSGRSPGGAAGQPCLVGNACNAGLVCRNNTCVAGGAAGQPCLSGGVCSSGLVCSNSVCAPVQCSGGACSCNSAADCPADQACDPNRHACTSACSATAPCNGGCCQQNGLCGPGTFSNACGAGGGVCAVCGGNTPICASAVGGGVCAASAQGTKPAGPGSGTNLAGPGATGGQPKTESAPVAPGASKTGMNNVAPTVKTAAPPQIQSFGVFPGPIPGGQKDVGRVDLTGVPAGGATVQISSDQPAIASVAAPVQVQGSGPSAGSAVIQVNTSPVSQPTDVTLSAQVVGSSQVSTTKLTVRPPQVSILDCSPGTFPSGSAIQCKVWLDGPAPGSAVPAAKAGAISASRSSAATLNPGLQIQVSTNNSQVASVPGGAISVPAGATSAEFQVPTTAYPEQVDLTISASSQGSTSESASVKLTAAVIRSFGCMVFGAARDTPIGSTGSSSCESVGGGGAHLGTSVVMTFSGPTPAGFVNVTSSSGGLICDTQWNCNSSLAVPLQTGSKWGAWDTVLPAVSVPTTATLSALDPLSNVVKTVQFKIDPPSPLEVKFSSGNSINNVLAGGQQVHTYVSFNGSPPDNGITFDVKYSASDAAGNALQGAITGPSQITVTSSNYNDNNYSFDVTVQPCEVNGPCKVSVTVGAVTGTLSVNP